MKGWGKIYRQYAYMSNMRILFHSLYCKKVPAWSSLLFRIKDKKWFNGLQELHHSKRFFEASIGPGFPAFLRRDSISRKYQNCSAIHFRNSPDGFTQRTTIAPYQVFINQNYSWRQFCDFPFKIIK